MTKALILLAPEGAEEIEVIVTGDVLVRGGIEVTYAGLDGVKPVKAARGALLVPNVALADVAAANEYDLIVLPGGQPGSNILAASKAVGNLIKNQAENGRLLGAICAAPIALAAHGIKATKVTSHPSVKQQLIDGGFNYSEDRVVVAGNVVTSRGPGTCFEFALKLVELLKGEEISKSLVEPMVLKL